MKHVGPGMGTRIIWVFGYVKPKKSRVWVVWFGYIPKIYVFIILRNELYVIVRKSSAKIN